MDRKRFIQAVLGTAAAAAVPSCKGVKHVKGSITGASASVGHLLRDKNFGTPTKIERKKIVVVGAGVSGLSAGYHLRKQGIDDFVVLDLEGVAGGNSANGSNEVSAYPLGAHYVPIPNLSLTEYIRFLEEVGVITGYANGLPVYNEFYLCHDPEERLYINGRWQEGLVPQYGLSDADAEETELFLLLMDDYRNLRLPDGKDAFALPVNASGTDDALTALDNLTMKQWMLRQGFKAEALHQYVDYCTRDDFGTAYDRVSAWAGIHYFACRKGEAANAHHSDVLTWPEGNGFLVTTLSNPIRQNIQLQSLVVAVQPLNGGVAVDYYHIPTQTIKRIQAEACAMAVPQFVAARLLKDERRAALVKQHIRYVPWMVANLKVRKLEERSGEVMSWDNVIHGGSSLGYVSATHQTLQQHLAYQNLTYYLPLCGADVAAERKAAQHRTHAEWVKMLTDDLRKVHSNIEEALEEVNVTVWGHAMAQPLPGWIHGEVRRQLAKPVSDRIHFAHTDLAGVSLFEEAFYQGLKAATAVEQIINQKQPLA